MSSLRSLLQDADPLRHEPPRLDADRERIRLSILQHIAVGRPTTPIGARLKLVAALAMVVMAMTAAGYQIWHGTTPVLAAVRFEVRLAEDQPIPGLVVARLADSGRVIYLHPEIVVSNDDIAQSWVSEDGPSQFGIAVQLLPSGAERMRQATTTHVGRPVAILIDGRVVMAPVVRAPISDSSVISGNYTRADAERIADGMRLR
jgi:preprotein translocase subunit SecD